MNKKSYKGLITLNIVLIVALVLVSIGPSESNAQNNNNRARGQYSALSMAISGSVTDAIAIIDANNQEIVALRWDASRRSLSGIDYVSLQDIANAGGGTRR